jgi:gluconate kinase
VLTSIFEGTRHCTGKRETIMLKKMSRLFNALLRRPSNRQKVSVYLDDEASGRLERLRQKLRTFDNSQLLALSLKALESKTDKIIKMRITKRVPELKREGLSEEAIAEYLNRQDIPVPAGKERWDGAMVSALIEESVSSSN